MPNQRHSKFPSSGPKARKSGPKHDTVGPVKTANWPGSPGKVGGMAYKTLEIVDAKTVANAADIGKVDEKANRNMERIHDNELVQTDINAKLTAVPKIEAKVDKLSSYIMQNWEFKDKGK